MSARRNYSIFHWMFVFPFFLIGGFAHVAGPGASHENGGTPSPLSDDSPWPHAMLLSDSGANAVDPVVAVCPNGNAHVAWVEGRDIYHRMLHDDEWSPAVRVAAGESPDLACSSDGELHMVFAYRFGGNYDIYACSWNGSWTLPHNISHTSGASGGPRIAIAADDTLHVVWYDNTPGYYLVYHAYKSNGYWNNAPLSQAQGTAPDVMVDDTSTVHVVWQEKGVGSSYYEVFHTQWNGHSWSLPENVSDTPGSHSLSAVVAGGGSNIHILWEEQLSQNSQIYHSSGHQGYWSVPNPVCRDSRQGHQPALAVDGMGYAYVIWLEGQRFLGSQIGPTGGEWWPPYIVAQSAYGLNHPSMDVGPDGSIHAVWAERSEDGFWEVMYSRRRSAWKRYFMPVG